MASTIKQSKKIKNNPNNKINKIQLWNVFDNEIVNENTYQFESYLKVIATLTLNDCTTYCTLTSPSITTKTRT